MLTEQNKQILITRAKASIWQIVMISMAFLLNFIGQSIGMFDLPSWVTVILGVSFTQISKYLNNRYDLEQYLRLVPTKD